MASGIGMTILHPPSLLFKKKIKKNFLNFWDTKFGHPFWTPIFGHPFLDTHFWTPINGYIWHPKSVSQIGVPFRATGTTGTIKKRQAIVFEI
jgi:hypothetical protein